MIKYRNYIPWQLTNLRTLSGAIACSTGIETVRWWSKNMQQTYRRTPMSKCDFNKVALQLFWNRTSTWVFSCKFATYFQNTFQLRTPLNGCFWREFKELWNVKYDTYFVQNDTYFRVDEFILCILNVVFVIFL